MRDLHSHYLPEIDDGASSIKVTENMLAFAKETGITDIVFTPHYIDESPYMSEVSNNKKVFEEVLNIASKYEINVYLGNEVYCSNNILKKLNEGKITTINNSRYMLIEIPLYNKMNNVKNILFELISNGIIPILAHPERYSSYYKDIDFFKELREMGVLFQINYPSVVGMYGKKAKVMSKKLLKERLVSFIGSDVHSDSPNRYEVLKLALKKIKKYDKKNYDDIVENNFLKVINNEEI